MEKDSVDINKSNIFNFKSITKFIIIIIFVLIVLGCIVAWHTNCSLLNNPNDLEKLKRVRESLMNANTITFLVTLVIGLLASLLVLRIDKIDSLVDQNEKLKTRISDYISNEVRFGIILTRIESIFYLLNMANNLTIQISTQHLYDFSQVGVICNRIVPIIYDIQIALNRKELGFTKATIEKKEILNTYVGNIIDILDEIGSSIKKDGSDIYKNIDKLCIQMSDIKDQIKNIPIENED